MAKHQKSSSPLQKQSIEVTAPNALIPLMQAFHVHSKKAAKALVMEAAYAIYGTANGYGQSMPFSKQDLEGITELIKGVNPQDTLETLYAAQIVVSHMLGMKKLSKKYEDDQKLGLNLLRFSSESMRQLHRKRCGGMQNITVNYNYSAVKQPKAPQVIRINEDSDAD